MRRDWHNWDDGGKNGSMILSSLEFRLQTEIQMDGQRETNFHFGTVLKMIYLRQI